MDLLFHYFGIGVEIGEKSYNSFDTGIFLCDPALFTAIETSSKNQQDDSLSGGVRILAKQGKAGAMSINGSFWCDIDDPDNFKQADMYLSSLIEKYA